MDDVHYIHKLQFTVSLDLVQIFDNFTAGRHDICGMQAGYSRRLSYLCLRRGRLLHINIFVYSSALHIGTAYDSGIRAEHTVFGIGVEMLRLSRLS